MLDTGPQHAYMCQNAMIFCANDYKKSFYTNKSLRRSHIFSRIGLMLLKHQTLAQLTQLNTFIHSFGYIVVWLKPVKAIILFLPDVKVCRRNRFENRKFPNMKLMNSDYPINVFQKSSSEVLKGYVTRDGLKQY